MINKDIYHYRLKERERLKNEQTKAQEKTIKLHPKFIKFLKKCFKNMDSDKDGYISPYYIDLSSINEVNLLKDILIEIDDK